MSRRGSYFHGTSGALWSEIRRRGLRGAHDAYAAGPAVWLTPDRSTAQRYAAARVSRDLVAAGDLSREAILRLPKGIVLEVLLTRGEVRQRRLVADEFYLRGDVEPDRIVGASTIDARAMLLATPPALLLALADQVRREQDDSGRNYGSRDRWDAFERSFAAMLPGVTDQPTAGLGGTMKAALSRDVLRAFGRP